MGLGSASSGMRIHAGELGQPRPDGKLMDQGTFLRKTADMYKTHPHARKSRIQGGQIDESLHFALTRPYLDGFTIGFSREADVDEIARQIERTQIEVGKEGKT
jgi:hypothetical protein